MAISGPSKKRLLLTQSGLFDNPPLVEGTGLLIGKHNTHQRIVLNNTRYQTGAILLAPEFPNTPRLWGVVH